jgi:hypothetical protein
MGLAALAVGLGVGGANLASNLYTGVQQKDLKKKEAAAVMRSALMDVQTEQERTDRLLKGNEAAAAATGLASAGSPLLVRAQNIKDSMEQRRRRMAGAQMQSSLIKQEGNMALVSGVFGGITSGVESGFRAGGYANDLFS